MYLLDTINVTLFFVLFFLAVGEFKCLNQNLNLTTYNSADHEQHTFKVIVNLEHFLLT